MTDDDQRSLRDRLTEAESFLEALQNQEVDAIVGRERVLLLRIRDLEREYSGLVENLPDVIFRLDTKLRHVYVSPVVELHTAQPPNAFLQKTWLEAGAPPDLWEPFEKACRELLRDGAPQLVNFPLETPHGLRQLQTRLFPEKDGDGSVQFILGITADLTEQRKAEEALRQSEQRLKAAIEGANLGAWDYYPATGECNHLSERMIDLYGLDPETPRASDPLLSAAHPEDKEALATALARANSDDGFDHTYRIVRPDGELRYIRLVGRGAPSENDGRIVGIAEDVTDRITSEQKLARARDAADSANKSKSDFLANMSHEIRTPLTAILGYADILRHQMTDDELGKECVDSIRLNGRLLVTIINDVLDLSKIEAGKMAVEPRPVSPRDLIEESIALMRGAAEAKDLPLVADYAPDLPAQVLTDPDRVKQILVNLISNAVKFTDSGEVRLSASYARADGLLRIAVADTGRGVAPDSRERIFQPFEQGRAARGASHSGTGLGLAICRRLSALLGGSLQLERSGPEGSVFALALPADAIDVTDTEGSSAHPQDAGEPERLLEGTRILIVEDQDDARRILEHFLRRLGGATQFAASGAEALALAASAANAPDLLLLDMRMPDMDGFETARRLRAQGFANPVIAITAHVMEADRDECLRAGCSDFLAKPIDHEQLVATLRRNLPAR